jgi:hypothetical protein
MANNKCLGVELVFLVATDKLNGHDRNTGGGTSYISASIQGVPRGATNRKTMNEFFHKIEEIPFPIIAIILWLLGIMLFLISKT